MNVRSRPCSRFEEDRYDVDTARADFLPEPLGFYAPDKVVLLGPARRFALLAVNDIKLTCRQRHTETITSQCLLQNIAMFAPGMPREGKRQRVLSAPCKIDRIPSRIATWLPTLSMLLVSLISYIDRNTLAILAPTILRETHLSGEQYGYIISAFSVAYMLGNPLWGIALDRFGIRWGMLAAVAFWSFASASHAFAAGCLSFAA
ncbi:MAG: MFS transporter, partial [Bryobacteraceae bacterium]